MLLKSSNIAPRFYILGVLHWTRTKHQTLTNTQFLGQCSKENIFLWKCSVRLISIFALRITTVSYSCQNTLFYTLCLCKARVLQGDGRNLASQQLERKQFARNLANLRFREKLSCQCQQPVCFIQWRLGLTQSEPIAHICWR